MRLLLSGDGDSHLDFHHDVSLSGHSVAFQQRSLLRNHEWDGR